MTSKQDYLSPATTISFQDKPPRLPTLRSQSFEIPRAKQQDVHAHFDKLTSIARPGMNKSSVSHSEGFSLRRPSLQSHKSYTRSLSSFSLYSNFAGERFNQNKKRQKNGRKLSKDTDIEKMNHKGSSSTLDDNSQKSFHSDEEKPKASVGKAMLMFF